MTCMANNCTDNFTTRIEVNLNMDVGFDLAGVTYLELCAQHLKSFEQAIATDFGVTISTPANTGRRRLVFWKV